MQTECTSTTTMTQTELAARISRLFWDRSLETTDIDAYPQWVIKRVLDYGDLPDVQAARTPIPPVSFMHRNAGMLASSMAPDTIKKSRA